MHGEAQAADGGQEGTDEPEPAGATQRDRIVEEGTKGGKGAQSDQSGEERTCGNHGGSDPVG